MSSIEDKHVLFSESYLPNKPTKVACTKLGDILGLVCLIVFSLVIGSALQAQEVEIEIVCPTAENWAYEPSSNLLFIDRTSSANYISLNEVSGQQVDEINWDYDGSLGNFLLSPTGKYLAYFEFVPTLELPKVVVLDIDNNTVIRPESNTIVTFQSQLLWHDENTLAIIPLSLSMDSQIILFNIDKSTHQFHTISLPTEIDYPVFGRYSPSLQFIVFMSRHQVIVANAQGEVLNTSPITDSIISGRSISWRDNSEEVIFYSDKWYIYSTLTGMTTPLEMPTSHVFDFASWSPNGELLAFIGVRIPPLDRPNILNELFIYDRPNKRFTDLCQIGDLIHQFESNGKYWSKDSQYLASVIREVDGTYLNVINLENLKIMLRLELEDENTQIIGWRD